MVLPDANAVHYRHPLHIHQFRALSADPVCNLADKEEAFEFSPIDWKTTQ